MKVTRHIKVKVYREVDVRVYAEMGVLRQYEIEGNVEWVNGIPYEVTYVGGIN